MTTTPYLTKSIYKNYEVTMKEKNIKRKKDGLPPIHVRTYQEWSNQDTKTK